MELNILRIDLDEPKRKKALAAVAERLRYFNDFEFIGLDYWHKIELIKKRTYGVKITLNKPAKDAKSIMFMQLIFGSDWRKEINTFFNHEVLEMDYSNRLFNGKAYKKGFYMGTCEDVTQELKQVATTHKVYNWRKFLAAKIKRCFE